MNLTGQGVLNIAFDGAGGGVYTFSDGSSGTVSSYTWQQEIYRGRLWPIYFSGLVPMTLRLDFASDTQGTLAGTAYIFTGPSDPPTEVPLSGTFQISP
jgi:hypothetical protein